MPVSTAYLGVIVIWTTTPLAIKWGAEGSHVLFAVTARMLIGTLLSLILLRLTRTPFSWNRKARHTYLSIGLGVYGAMILVYWGAQFIPSGLVSVIFGLAPITTSLLAVLLINENNLTAIKLGSMGLGLFGLIVIFNNGMTFTGQAGWGIAAVFTAMIIHCSSAVWVKRIDSRLPALTSTTGGLIVATFLLQTTWIVLDAHLPGTVTTKAAWSIIYLGMAGSVLGFSLYFYLLKHCEATQVALITLITPVSALLLGVWLNDESLTWNLSIGTGIILLGLVLFQFGDNWLYRLLRGDENSCIEDNSQES